MFAGTKLGAYPTFVVPKPVRKGRDLGPRKPKPESKKRKTLEECCSPYRNDFGTATEVSMMEQAPEPGRNTLENALSAGFTNFDVIDDAL